MPGQVECCIREVPGVRSAQVKLVWDPPWSRDRLDDFTRLELGLL
jgi:metal-sulfur cluster biosynthetic enzyme